MSAEVIAVFALEVALFASALTLGFKATLAEPFFLFRHPGLLVRTFLAVYVVVPMVTVVVLGLVPLPLAVKVGLVLLAISSAETTAPKEMLALGGNPAYVFSLLITMSLVAVMTVPLSLAILTALPLAADASVPPLQVAKVVALTFLVPLAAGALIGRLAPRFAERIDKPLSAAAAYALPVVLLSLLVLNFSGVWDIGLPSFLVIAGLSAVALAAGHWLGGPNPGDRASLAVAACSRHTGMAALIAALNFPAKSTMVIIVIYQIATLLGRSRTANGAKSRWSRNPWGLKKKHSKKLTPGSSPPELRGTHDRKQRVRLHRGWRWPGGARRGCSGDLLRTANAGDRT